jgi:hypothetical protein
MVRRVSYYKTFVSLLLFQFAVATISTTGVRTKARLIDKNLVTRYGGAAATMRQL